MKHKALTLTPFIFLCLITAFIAGPFLARAQTTYFVNSGGGVTLSADSQASEPQTAQDYLSNLYNFLLGFVGIAAMGSIVYGGVLYILSAGNPSRVGSAKDAIWNGIIGILIAGFGYLILATINPDLVGGFNLQQIVTNNLNKAQQR